MVNELQLCNRQVMLCKLRYINLACFYIRIGDTLTLMKLYTIYKQTMLQTCANMNDINHSGFLRYVGRRAI